MNIVICRTRFADNNVGERLILRSILEKLSRIPDIHITVLSNTPKLTKKVHGVNVADCSLRHYYQAVSAIQCSDLVLWGGGNMLQEQFTHLHIPFAAKDLLQAKMLGKKTFIYAVEVGPIVSVMGKLIARMVLRNADVITVRNIQSLRIAKELGAQDRKILLTEDPVFSISTDGLPDRKQILERFSLDVQKPMVGICPRIILDRQRGYLPFRFRLKYGLLSQKFYDMRRQVKDFIIQISSFLSDKANTKVVFLPMDLSDEAFCDEIIGVSRRPMMKVSLNSLKLKEIMGLFSLMDLVVSMRLHGLILASCLAVPVISISGVTKNLNLLSKLGCEENNIDVEDLSVEKFGDIFHSVWSDREKSKQQIQEKVAAMKKREEQNFKVLINFLDREPSSKTF